MRRFWPLIVGVLLVVGATAVPVSASASPSASTIKSTARPGTHGGYGSGKGVRATVTRTAKPPTLTPAQQLLRQEAANHRTSVPYSAGTVRPIISKSAPSTAAPRRSTSKAKTPLAPTDFNYFRATDMTPYTSSGASSIDEPSTSNLGYDVLYTGNWYAALSTDSGHSFTFVNPYTFFTAAGGFCCDQVTISDYSRGLSFWLLQGCNVNSCNTGDNTDRIAWANQANEAANNWFTVDFSAQTFGFPEGDWLDYPHFALGANSLYWSTNVFDSTTNCNGKPCFVQTVMTRFDLDPFTTGGYVYNYMYVNPNQDFTWTATDTRGGTTEYWATVGNCGFLCDQFIRIYQWPEGTNYTGVTWHDFHSCCFGNRLNGFTYMNLDGSCPAPDANNWCARDDSRVKTGWQSGNTLSFQWDARQDGTFPYPYVDQANFDVSGGTPSFVSNGQIWNSSYAWVYPGAGVDGRGHLGESIAIGGGTWGYPGSQFLICDDITCDFHFLDNGSHAAGGWGDFLNARPATYPGSLGNTWVASGFTLYDNGFGGAYTKPVFYWVGRERDDPFAPGAGIYNLGFNEGISQFSNTGYFYGPSNCACDYAPYNYWGDGGVDLASTSPVPNDAPYFYTFGTHTYGEEGNYSSTVGVFDNFNHSSFANGTNFVFDSPLSATGTTLNLAEGANFSGVVANFTDGDPFGTAGDYTASINWGDSTTSAGSVASNGQGGFSVSGGHTYAEAGGYAISISISDFGGFSASAGSTANVTDYPITGSGTSISKSEGSVFTGVVGTITDSDPSTSATDYTATINWGDGHTTSGSVSAGGGAGQYNISGTHTYAEQGSYSITVTVNDVLGGIQVTVGSTANVGDGALTATGKAVSSTEGATFSGAVASFTDAGAGTASDFTATVSWGDGSTTAGTVSGSAGSYTVSGSHKYVEQGSYVTKVSITDNGGSTATAGGTATVGDAALTAVGKTVFLVEGASFTGVMATFTDAGVGTASDFTATITWGDGSSSTGTISGAAGSYKVNGTHKYAEEGTRAVGVAIKDVGGSTATASSTAKVADAALTSTGKTVSGREGIVFTAVVASFTDKDPAGLATDYKAVINWGDGSTSTGTITKTLSGFTVTGSHGYVEGATYTVKVTITDHGASSVATTTATIFDPAP